MAHSRGRSRGQFGMEKAVVTQRHSFVTCDVACRANGALPPPLAGEGWGEGFSATGRSPRGENPHPPRGDDASHRAARVGLSRKRERREPVGLAQP
ncbi:hypothetical protein DCM75_08310 [Bradyrhizobium sp. WBOS02]|uniref:Uncharacterized protein n=1 Tax=Bradyrhizobium betae TaxID=244734 RepID=A0AAE9STN9_9BRAD|nr:hypothetical protein DCK84_06885 [Bradyrhizobium sp. WBOS01]UUO40757.1 hypothetical protein DCM75_08310 [Bradyrhizobium sp. WBOS02]UUO52855.1 hypothetical protein DCM79_07580 [Bradyrhizobium sp. WBOS07]UUO65026.1 hypothetical protein DCM83_07205 [Bradyrhizobium betae]